MPGTERASRRTAVATMAGLVVCGALVLAVFVVPHWTRLPVLQLADVGHEETQLRCAVAAEPGDVVSHRPRHLHEAVVPGRGEHRCPAGFAGAMARSAAAGTSPHLWVGLGAFELLVHDVGNERRFIFFIPALAALTALVLGRDRRLLPTAVLGPRPTFGTPRAPVRLLCRLCRRRRARSAHGAVRAGAGRPPRRAVALCSARFCALRHMVQADEILAGRQWTVPRQSRSCRAPRLRRPARPVRTMGPTARPTRTISRWSSWADSCLRARSSTASSPTGCRSRTASSPSSSGADLETTTTGSSATMCGIF